MKLNTTMPALKVHCLSSFFKKTYFYFVLAFRLMRGTLPYFQDKKLSVMAMLQQLGPPHLFITLSAAEVGLVSLIFEGCTDAIILCYGMI